MRSMSETSESKVLNLTVYNHTVSRARASLDVVEFLRMLALSEVFIFQTFIKFCFGNFHFEYFLVSV